MLDLPSIFGRYDNFILSAKQAKGKAGGSINRRALPIFGRSSLKSGRPRRPASNHWAAGRLKAK